MKRHPYYYLILNTIILAHITFFYAQKNSVAQNATNSCSSSYELLNTKAAMASAESVITSVNLEQIIRYLKQFDMFVQPQNDTKDLMKLVAENLLEIVLEIPLADIKTESVAAKLQNNLPQAYSFFLNMAIFSEKPSDFFDIMSTEYEIVKENISLPLQKLIETLLIFVKAVIDSNDSIDKNALIAIQKITKNFICKKFGDNCCLQPGIITTLLQNSLHQDASGQADGIKKLMNEPIQTLANESIAFMTEPSVYNPLHLFFLHHATSLFDIHAQLQAIPLEDIQKLKPEPTASLQALLSKAENSIEMAKSSLGK